MDPEVKLEIKLPHVPDIELVAVEGLEKMGKFCGITNDKIGEAKIIVAEAIINALEHSGDEKACVNVEFIMNNKKLVILVTDYGKGFKPEAIEEPDINKKISDENKRGWGLKLMKSMSDDMIIESGETGTRISIIKHLS